MGFRITGLDPEPFKPLFALSDEALAARHVIRSVADAAPGYPCRVEMREVEPGQRVLLLNHVYQPADTPYRAMHAIFVREGATARFDAVDEVPEVLRPRMLSLRAFDAAGMMVDADLVDGGAVESLIERLLADRRVDYLHAHYAKRGCFAGRIERAH